MPQMPTPQPTPDAGSCSGAGASTCRTSRRVFLRGAAAGGAALAVAGVAGCGGSGGAGSAGAAGAGSPGTGSAAASSAAGASSAPAAGGTPGVVAAADVPVGGGIIVGEQKLVVTQPAKGSFKAFSSTCTHQNCQVGSVSGDTIECPCHGSKFSIQDGSAKKGPATAPLKEVAVKVDGGQVVRA